MVYRLVLPLVVAIVIPVSAQVSWNPGIPKCVASVNSTLPNYFSEISQCDGPVKWLVGVQAESGLAQSCIGSNGQSLPISPDSPISLTWGPQNVLRMRVDFYHFRHPCPGPVWTWLSIMDHSQAGGGPIPNADRLKIHLRGVFYEAIGDQGGMSRAGVSWTGVWDGRDISVEIQLYTHPHWGDNHPDSDISWRYESPDRIYVQMRGDMMNPAYKFSGIGLETSVTVDMGTVLQNLAARGLIPAPNGKPSTVVGGFVETRQDTRNRRSIAAQMDVYELQSYE